MMNQGQPQRSLKTILRRLEWTVLRPLASRLGGEERSLFRGAGVEFDGLRPYQPGDDVRMIDWNVTARAGASTDTAYVRQSVVQRAVDVWIGMDLSPSVDWGTAQCLKRERAVEFTAAAGQIFERGRHHIGALFFADRPMGMAPPAAGRQHLLRLLDQLLNAPPQAQRGQTDLNAALERLSPMLPHRAVILLVSDFLVKDGWQAALARLARQHEVIAIRLADPREMELPDVGLITFEDPETGRQRLINTSDAGLRERFRQAASEQSAQIRRQFTTRGVDYLELSTGADLLPVMIRFLENRKHQAQLIQRGRAA